MTALDDLYHPGFYTSQRGGSLEAARRILPSVFEVVKPSSMIDVGCGVGTWLAVAGELGVTRLVGIEGDWVRTRDLESPTIDLITHDLERPLPTTESFDFAISLEVAEHLSPERGPSLVEEICGLSRHVMFGAAVPGQGGVNHVNERWQTYWVDLFREQGFRALDIIRPRFWNETEIPIHYRQNPFLFVHESAFEGVRSTVEDLTRPRPWELDLVHPEMHLNNLAALTAPPTLRKAVGTTLRLPLYLARSIQARLSRR